MLENFSDKEDPYFHFSSGHAEKLIARKKEIFDNVIPASNSMMAQNLYHLGIILDKEAWKEKALTMVSKLKSIISSEPGYMSNWGILFSEMVKGIAEVVIVGPQAEEKRKELARHSLPFTVMMGTHSHSELPLFEGRNSNDSKTRIYVCFDKACQLPVETSEEAIQQLN